MGQMLVEEGCDCWPALQPTDDDDDDDDSKKFSDNYGVASSGLVFAEMSSKSFS